MSADDQEGRRMVQISFQQLDDLKTKLINAIQVQITIISKTIISLRSNSREKKNIDWWRILTFKVLSEIPESKAALENVNVFKKAWVDQV